MGPVRIQQPAAVQGRATIKQREHDLTFSSTPWRGKWRGNYNKQAFTIINVSSSATFLTKCSPEKLFCHLNQRK